MNSKPLRPAGAFTPTLPKGWANHFIPVLARIPEVDFAAQFVGVFFAAADGNPQAFEALARINAGLLLLKPHATPQDKQLSEHMAALVKLLTERLDRFERKAAAALTAEPAKARLVVIKNTASIVRTN